MTIDVARLIDIEIAIVNYRGELRFLAASADLDTIVGKHLFGAAKHLNIASEALQKAVLEASMEEHKHE